jgi:hypothetical protein
MLLLEIKPNFLIRAWNGGYKRVQTTECILIISLTKAGQPQFQERNREAKLRGILKHLVSPCLFFSKEL